MKMTKLTNKCIRVKTHVVFLVGGGRPEPRAAYTFRDDASGGVAPFRYPVQGAGRVEHMLRMGNDLGSLLFRSRILHTICLLF
jgi:hypothetical protein